MPRAWLAVLMLLAFPTLAAAQPSDSQKNAARALANAGFELYGAGDYRQALERFQGAEQIVHAPPHLLFIARCQSKLGQLLAARDAYLKVLDDELAAGGPSEFRDAHASAASELNALVSRIPTIKVEVSGAAPAQVRVSIDGAGVDDIATPMSLEPGEHVVTAEAPGYDKSEQRITLGEGAREVIALRLRATGSAPSGDEPLAAAPETDGDGGASLAGPGVLLGLGAAGLVVGAVTGGLALAKASDLESACPVRTQCPPENEKLEDDARTLGTVSTVGLAIGGASAAAGIIWLAVELAGGGDESARLAPWISPTGGALCWRF